MTQVIEYESDALLKKHRKSQGFTGMRCVHTLQLLVRLLPKVRDETHPKLNTDGIESLGDLFGRERAACFADSMQQNIRLVVQDLQALEPRVIDNLHAMSDARRDLFARVDAQAHMRNHENAARLVACLERDEG